MKLTMPVRGGRITSRFGDRVLRGRSEFHPGVDIIGADLTVMAAADGEVVRVDANDSKGYGLQVLIRHRFDEGQRWTQYGHLASASVKIGDAVKAGQPIGVMGNSGRSFGIHLHFELRTTPGAHSVGGKVLDPAPYL